MCDRTSRQIPAIPPGCHFHPFGGGRHVMRMRHARLLVVAALILGCGAQIPEDGIARGDAGGPTLSPAMVIVLPDASTAAEAFSNFLRSKTESEEWHAQLRQLYHLTLGNAVSSVLKQRTNTTACAAQGKSLVFLLAASTGELDALREQAQLAGEAAAAHGSAKRTSKKRRQKKVAADLRSNCVAWLDQKDDLELVAGLGVDEVTAAMHALPSPWRNSIRQEEDRDEDEELESSTGKALPKSWFRRSSPAERHPPLGAYLTAEAGARAYSNGNFTAAIAFFETAARLEPTSPKPLNRVAMAHMAAGQREEGMRVYRDVVRQFPSDITARLQLGGALQEGQRGAAALDEARELLQKAVDIAPSASTHAALGHVLRKIGHNDDAHAAYNASLAALAAGGLRRAEPTEVEEQGRVLHGIGLLLAEAQGRLDDGIASVARAAGISAFDEQVLADLARLLVRRAAGTVSDAPAAAAADLKQAHKTLERAIDVARRGGGDGLCAQAGARQQAVEDIRGVVRDFARTAAASGSGVLENGNGWEQAALAKLMCPSSKDEL